jgi:hypothetical protein
MDINVLKSAGATWLRASLAAVAALYMSGVTDPKTLLNAFIAGIIGPAAKFINPKDPSYGFGSKK